MTESGDTPVITEVQIVSVDFELLTGGLPLKAYIENMEIALIRRALVESKGVVAHAAKRLQIRRTTLAEKMKRYGIHAERAENRASAS